MVLPADQVGQARRDRLIGQQVVQAEHQGADQQHHQQHPQQLALVAAEEFGARRGLGHVDQAAEEAEQCHLDQRGEEADHQHCEHQRPDLAQVMGIERQDARGRLDVRAGFEYVDQGFEVAKQHVRRPALVVGVLILSLNTGARLPGKAAESRPPLGRRRLPSSIGRARSVLGGQVCKRLLLAVPALLRPTRVHKGEGAA
ncbi:hypothetical protein D3C72_1366560 [compost metagenome]